MMKKGLIGLALGCALALSAQAHQVWMEREGDVIKAYFGHWSHDLIEEKGKAFDNVKLDKFLPEGSFKKSERLQNHVRFDLSKVGDTAIIEAMPVRKSKLTNKATQYTFLAREGRREVKSLTILDLVPDKAGGDTFTVMFDGKPLPRVDVTLYAPHKWSKTFKSNDEGKITILTPWKGMYLAEVNHTDEDKGVMGDQEYDERVYIYTLVFKTEKGIDWKN